MPDEQDDPIQARHREAMQKMAAFLDSVFNPDPSTPKQGFALLVFDFESGGFMNYISNAKRDTMVTAMEEFIKRQVGRN